MASLTDLSDLDLEKQVAMLSKELTKLKKTVGKRGSAIYDDTRETAWDYYADLAERVGDALPAFNKRARAFEKSARDHPATAAAVGLVVVGLVASLLISRR